MRLSYVQCHTFDLLIITSRQTQRFKATWLLCTLLFTTCPAAAVSFS
jgi:hypothetical protein